ncbi:hypothetical protein BDK51DRAFT_49352, partial [Blyttiomyces helicus]
MKRPAQGNHDEAGAGEDGPSAAKRQRLEMDVVASPVHMDEDLEPDAVRAEDADLVETVLVDDAIDEEAEPDEPPPREDLVLEGEGDANYEVTARSPSYSPPPLDAPPTAVAADTSPEAQPTIWTGRIVMKDVARFDACARQVGGIRDVPARGWEDLVPPTVTIEGRIAVSAAEKYLEERRRAGGHDVLVI